MQSFNDDELKEFKKFVASPVYSFGRNYEPVINGIIRYMQSLDSKRRKPEVYFPADYGKQTLKNRQSELFRLGEEFLIFRRVEQNRVEKDKLLLRSYTDRGLNKFFDTRVKGTLEYLEKTLNDDSKFSDIEELQRIEIDNAVKANKFNKYFPLYFENSFYFTCLSFIRMYEFGMEFRQQFFLNKKYEFNLVTDILQKINFDEIHIEEKYKESVIYKTTLMFYNLYKAYEDLENEQNYFRARKIFNSIKGELSDDLKLKIYMICIYYSAHRQNVGIKRFQQELFELFNEKLESGFVSDFSENIYPLNNFRDYVFIGLEVNQPDWVYRFIEKYSQYLPDALRENEVSLSYAKVAFAEEDFESTLELLKNVKPSNFLHYFDTSILRMCSYYELDLIEEAFAEIDKDKHYLRNHSEIPKIHKTFNNNFVKMYNRLIKAKIDTEIPDFSKLKNDLKAIDHISRRKWVFNKIIELENSRSFNPGGSKRLKRG